MRGRLLEAILKVEQAGRRRIGDAVLNPSGGRYRGNPGFGWCGARGVASHASPGTLWVTVRRHNDRLPFSGLDVAGRAGRNPRARDP
jgi:hypothetical protein